jgi:hypothetical protein
VVIRAARSQLSWACLTRCVKRSRHGQPPFICELPGFLEWSRYLVRPVRLAGQYGITPFIRFFKGIFQS